MSDAATHAAPERKPSSGERRFDHAVDVILNSATMFPYMDDFWRFVDGKLTYAEWQERAPR